MKMRGKRESKSERKKERHRDTESGVCDAPHMIQNDPPLICCRDTLHIERPLARRCTQAKVVEPDREIILKNERLRLGEDERRMQRRSFCWVHGHIRILSVHMQPTVVYILVEYFVLVPTLSLSTHTRAIYTHYNYLTLCIVAYGKFDAPQLLTLTGLILELDPVRIFFFVRR